MTPRCRAVPDVGLFAISLGLLLAVPGMITGLEISQPMLAAALLACAATVAIALPPRPAYRTMFGGLTLACLGYFLLYIMLIAAADMPPVLDETRFNTWAFAAVGFVFVGGLVLSAVRSISPDAMLRAVHIALFAICACQMLLYLSGIEHSGRGDMPQIDLVNSTLSMLGITVRRVAFPISSGIQYSAVYPALLLALSLVWWKKGIIYLVSGTLAFAMLVMIDTRGALFAPFLAVLTMAVIRKPTAIALAGTAIPALPVMAYIARDTMQPLVALVLPERNRSAEMFSNRGYIWEQYFTNIDRWSLPEILFGQGGYGQYTSHLNRHFSDLFANFTSIGRLTVHMHNSYMQVLVDFGVVGLSALCFLIFAIFARAAGNKSLLAVLFTMQWLAGSEVVLTPYAREGVLAVMVLWLVTALYGARVTHGSGSGTSPSTRQLGRRV